MIKKITNKKKTLFLILHMFATISTFSRQHLLQRFLGVAKQNSVNVKKT